MSCFGCYTKDTPTSGLPPAVLDAATKLEKLSLDSVEPKQVQVFEEDLKVQSKLADMASKHENEVKALMQKIDLNDQFAKADILHLKLSHQEELNDKNSEIRALKLKLRHLTNKTELR